MHDYKKQSSNQYIYIYISISDILKIIAHLDDKYSVFALIFYRAVYVSYVFHFLILRNVYDIHIVNYDVDKNLTSKNTIPTIPHIKIYYKHLYCFIFSCI